MKIQLFDDDDLKRIEDCFAKALVRALRTVMKEGLIAGYTPPKPEAFADARPTTSEPAPLAPSRPAWAQPAQPQPEPEPEKSVIFGMHIGEPQSGHGFRPTLPIADGPPDLTPRRRDMTQFCKSVSERPQGYITTEEAYKLMGVKEAHTQGYLRGWIQAGDVQGVIVCGQKGVTPTKGLPGRLMVDKAQVIAREKLRARNSEDMRRIGRGNWNGRKHAEHAAAAD